jgi:hypothetical protein
MVASSLGNDDDRTILSVYGRGYFDTTVAGKHQKHRSNMANCRTLEYGHIHDERRHKWKIFACLQCPCQLKLGSYLPSATNIFAKFQLPSETSACQALTSFTAPKRLAILTRIFRYRTLVVPPRRGCLAAKTGGYMAHRCL